jgi:hypothetical protein
VRDPEGKLELGNEVGVLIKTAGKMYGRQRRVGQDSPACKRR